MHLDLFAARVSELLPGVARRVSLVSSPEAPLPTLAATHLPALQQLAPQFLAACKRASEASQRRSILANQHATSLAAARTAAQAASEAVVAAKTAHSRLLRGSRNAGSSTNSASSSSRMNDLAQLERLIGVCSNTRTCMRDALMTLFSENGNSNNAGSNSSSGGDICAQLETDATAAAVATASAHPNGVFTEGCTLLESTVKAMGKGGSGKGKGGGSSSGGGKGGWSTTGGSSGSGSSSNHSANIGKGTSSSLPDAQQVADLRALCGSADQQRQSALDASAAALVGAASALQLYRSALCEAGLFPQPSRDPRIHEAMSSKHVYHSDGSTELDLPSSASAIEIAAAAAQYAGQGIHAQVLAQMQVALVRADRLTHRLAPRSTTVSNKKQSEKTPPPSHLSARSYAAERRFWEPLALAAQPAAAAGGALSSSVSVIRAATGGNEGAKCSEEQETKIAEIVSASQERLMNAIQFAARDVQLLESALFGVDPHFCVAKNESAAAAAAATAAHQTDASLSTLRGSAASEFKNLALAYLVPQLPLQHGNMASDGLAYSQHTREVPLMMNEQHNSLNIKVFIWLTKGKYIIAQD